MVCALVSAAARSRFPANSSTTVFWKEAAKSARFTSSPFCRALCSRLSTAVFNPEKLKS